VNESAPCSLFPVYFGLGADIEQIRSRGACFAEAYDTAVELSLLEAAPTDQYDTLSTAIWSAKEATLKLTRHGLRVDTRAVTCLPAPAVEGGWAPVAIITELTSVPTAGWWRVSGGCVITIVAGVEDGWARGGATRLPAQGSFSNEEEQCRTISTGCGR
jgi:hypothetical protein